MLVIGCLLWGSPFAIGTNDEPSTYHEGCGFAVFVVGLGLECLFAYLLVRLSPLKPEEVRSVRRSPPPSPPPSPPAPIPSWRSGTIFAFALAMLVLFLVTPPVLLPKEPGVVMELPDEVKLAGLDGGHFYGSPAPVSDAEHRLLPKDTEYARKDYDDFPPAQDLLLDRAERPPAVHDSSAGSLFGGAGLEDHGPAGHPDQTRLGPPAHGAQPEPGAQ